MGAAERGGKSSCNSLCKSKRSVYARDSFQPARRLVTLRRSSQRRAEPITRMIASRLEVCLAFRGWPVCVEATAHPCMLSHYDSVTRVALGVPCTYSCQHPCLAVERASAFVPSNGEAAGGTEAYGAGTAIVKSRAGTCWAPCLCRPGY